MTESFSNSMKKLSNAVSAPLAKGIHWKVIRSENVYSTAVATGMATIFVMMK